MHQIPNFNPLQIPNQPKIFTWIWAKYLIIPGPQLRADFWKDNFPLQSPAFWGEFGPYNARRWMLDGSQNAPTPSRSGLWPVEVVVQVISTSRFRDLQRALIENRITKLIWYDWGATWLHVFGATKQKKHTDLAPPWKKNSKKHLPGSASQKRKGSSSNHPFFRCGLLVSEKVWVASCVSQKHIVFCVVFFHLPDGFAATNSTFSSSSSFAVFFLFKIPSILPTVVSVDSIGGFRHPSWTQNMYSILNKKNAKKINWNHHWLGDF